jgi:hypothetical protein
VTEKQPVKIAETKTPHDWAVAHGRYVSVNPLIPQVSNHYKPDHAAADLLHGWTRFAYDYQAAPTFRLSEADYLAALEAARTYPVNPAHEAAIPRK